MRWSGGGGGRHVVGCDELEEEEEEVEEEAKEAAAAFNRRDWALQRAATCSYSCRALRIYIRAALPSRAVSSLSMSLSSSSVADGCIIARGMVSMVVVVVRVCANVQCTR